jgi:hypothetical protein
MYIEHNNTAKHSRKGEPISTYLRRRHSQIKLIIETTMASS